MKLKPSRKSWLITELITFSTFELARLEDLFWLVWRWCLSRNCYRRIISRPFSNLVVCKSAERTYKFYRRSKSAIGINKVSFVKIEIYTHMLLIV